MLREYSKIIGQLTQIMDLILILFSFYLAVLLYEYKQVLIDNLPISYIILLISYILIWILISNANELYESRRERSSWHEISKMVWLQIISAAFSLLIIQLYNPRQINNRFSFYFVAISTFLTLSAHIAIRAVLYLIRRSGYNQRFVLLIGSGHAAEEIVRKVKAKPESGYAFIGYISENENDTLGIGYLGSPEDLPIVLKDHVIDLVVQTTPVDSNNSSEHLDLLRLAGKMVIHYTDDLSIAKLRAKAVDFAGLTALTFDNSPIYGWQAIFKSILDVAGALSILIISSPIMLVIALLVKTTSKGPVFFVQNRVGLNGRKFKMYKFRTMVNDAEAQKETLFHLNEMDGPVFKIRNDPRITPIGKFLRRSSLDELPQLFNILHRDMSLVGPRPAVPSEVNLYDPAHRKRLSVKPGLTCIWQVSGRNDINFEQWMKMDSEYIDNWSIWLDLKLIIKTAGVVLVQRGAS